MLQASNLSDKGGGRGLEYLVSVSLWPRPDKQAQILLTVLYEITSKSQLLKLTHFLFLQKDKKSNSLFLQNFKKLIFCIFLN